MRKVVLFLISISTLTLAVDFQANIAYSKISGNSDDETLSGKLEYRKEFNKNSIFAKLDSLYSKSDNERNANKVDAKLQLQRDLTLKSFLFVETNYILDEFAGYDYKVNIGPGYGYRLLSSEKHKLNLLSSLLYGLDRYSSGEDESYLSTKFEFNYINKLRDNIDFKQNLSYEVSLESSSIYFAISESSIEFKINEYIGVGFTYKLDYKSELPNDIEENLEKILLTSLIVKF